MNQDPSRPRKYKGGLQRLDPARYRGRAYVHWTMTVKDRRSGWLSQEVHEWMRVCLFQALARYRLCCPVYCLMPDHGHFLFIGLEERSEQRRAVAAFRQTWNETLAPVELQKQPFDSVLTEEERQRDRFADLVGYILRNPVRRELVDDWRDWGFSGSVLPGYPKLDPRKFHFWENFWGAYLQQSGERPL